MVAVSCRHVSNHWSIRRRTAASCQARSTTMIRTARVAGLLTALIVLIAGVSACRHTPDEEQVRQAIAAVSRAAEAGSANGVIAPLSEDFDGNSGELDRRSLGNMIRLVALRGEHVGVTSGRGVLLPGRLGVYRVESAWREEDGRWRCYSASWKHAAASAGT